VLDGKAAPESGGLKPAEMENCQLRNWTQKTAGWFALSVCLITLASTCQAEDAPLEAGVAVVDITPPLGYRMAGYYSERFNTGTKDPLNAKVIVFRQGETSTAMIFCDLIGLIAEQTGPARQEIEKATGIPVEAINISATHSHTGPLFWGLFRDQFHQDAIKEHGKDIREEIDYNKFLTECWVKGVKEAQSKLAPVQLSHGRGKETRLAFNRRFFMNDGSVVFNPGLKNPNIDRAAGPIDPTVEIIRVQSDAGETPVDLGTIISFALHLDTVGGTEYSADFPAYLQQTLQKELGSDSICLFGNGTCGDINHVDAMGGKVGKTAEIGQMLGETVIAELSRLAPVKTPELAFSSVRYEQAVQTRTAEELETAWKYFPPTENNVGPPYALVKAYTTIDLQQYKNGVTEVEVSVVKLSDDLAIVFLPGEVFVELGMEIKDLSPFEQTLVVELANDCPYYVPTARGYMEGSYEVMNSRLAPGAGEVMVKCALEQLNQLHQGK